MIHWFFDWLFKPKDDALYTPGFEEYRDEQEGLQVHRIEKADLTDTLLLCTYARLHPHISPFQGDWNRKRIKQLMNQQGIPV